MAEQKWPVIGGVSRRFLRETGGSPVDSSHANTSVYMMCLQVDFKARVAAPRFYIFI